MVLFYKLSMLDTVFSFIHSTVYLISIIISQINHQLHAESRIQKGRQREPSVKTLRYPLYKYFYELNKIKNFFLQALIL